MPSYHPVRQKTFDLDADGRLFLRLPRAAVHLHGGTSGQIQVEVRIAEDDAETAQRLTERLRFKLRHHEETVRCEAEALPPFELGQWCTLPSPLFKVDVHVPSACHVDASTFGGALEAEDLNGHLILNAHAGRLRGAHLSGRVELQAHASQVDLSHIRGRHLRLQAGSSHVQVRDVTTEQIALKLTGTEGTMQAINSQVYLDLSDTALALEDVQGKLTGTSHAGHLAVHLNRATPPDMQLRTPGGVLDLHLRLPLAARLQLAAEHIDFDPPAAFSGDHAVQRVEGVLHEGETPIRVRGAEGQVRCQFQA